MKQTGAIALHLLALPAAVLLALASAVFWPRVTGEAIDIQLHDTMFVVAHFHASIALGACVVVVTIVAYCCKSMNWVLAGAWACFVLSAATACAPWGIGESLRQPDTLVFVRPSHPGTAGLYLVSSIVGLVVCVTAWVRSFWTSVVRARVRT